MTAKPGDTATPRILGTGAAGGAVGQRRAPRLHALTIVALVVLAGLSLAGGWGTREVVRDQEHRLLRQRVEELSVDIEGDLGSTQTSLAWLGGALRLSGESATAFQRAVQARPASSGRAATLALLRPVASGFQVVAAVGAGLSSSELVTGVRAQVLGRAMSSGQMLTTPVMGAGAGRTIGFALGPPAAPAGSIVYEQLALGPVSAPREAATAPYSELNVILYAVPKVDAQQLLVTTDDAPLSGPTADHLVAVGGSQWLVAASAKGPLVGSLANDTPWFVLVAGLIGSLLIATVVEVLMRRRDEAFALYAIEHTLSETLQRSLLPELPSIPGLDTAARYLVGAPEQEVGGDWFDVFPIDGERVGFAVGDVVGHDITAAASMSQVRAALRAYAFEGEEPAAVLTRLDRLVEAFALTPLVTVFYGLLEAPSRDGSRLLRFASAGHLPPLVQGPGGDVRKLPHGLSSVIGAPSPPQRGQAEEVLVAGTTLLLYTDGLIETPGRTLDGALDEVEAVVSSHDPVAGADALCQRVAEMLGDRALRDDVVLLAIGIDLPQPIPPAEAGRHRAGASTLA
jgi:serine phosphatase RsbU (regulator of sigma subunit)